MPFASQILLATFVLAAGAYDLRVRRIPNWLVGIGLVLGFAINITLFGWDGLKASLLGIGIATIIYLPLYALRAMGAGDVKLMMAIGSIVGPGPWIGIFLITGILGGIVAMCLLILKKRVGHSMVNLTSIFSSLSRLRAPYKENPELDVRNERALRLPHGAVIAFATILFLSVGKLLSKF
jgi:prepilin peptidase CpaA